MPINQPDPDYELSRERDLWVALHVDTGIASQGDTPNEAVEMVDEAVRLHQQDHEPAGEEYQKDMLERYDIDID